MTNESAASARGETESQFGGGGMEGREEGAAFTGWKANRDVTSVCSPPWPREKDLFREAAFPLRWRIFLFSSSQKWTPTTKQKTPWMSRQLGTFVAPARVLTARAEPETSTEEQWRCKTSLVLTRSWNRSQISLNAEVFVNSSDFCNTPFVANQYRAKGHKQIIVFVMWKTFASLSGIFPLTKPRSRSGLWEPHHKTPTHQFPVLVLCRPKEPHPGERGIQSAAMPPWTGKLVTQSELFTDDCVALLQMLQSAAFIGSQMVEKRNSRTNLVRKTVGRAGQLHGCDGLQDVCAQSQCQGEMLCRHYPQSSGEVRN